MCSPHCSRAVLAALIAALPWSALSAQDRPSTSLRTAASSAASFTVFIRATQLGSEQVTVARTADGWTITGSGRLGPPLDVAAQRMQIRYDRELEAAGAAARRRRARQSVRAPCDGQRRHHHRSSDRRRSDRDSSPIPPIAGIFLPNPFFARRTRRSPRSSGPRRPGRRCRVHATPQMPVSIRVGESVPDAFRPRRKPIDARHTRIAIARSPDAPAVDADVWGDRTGRLLRLSVPAQCARRRARGHRVGGDAPRARSRGPTTSRSGFRATASRSRARSRNRWRHGRTRLAGRRPRRRQRARPIATSSISGIPILGQLADAVADAGFVTLRYDKRGVGPERRPHSSRRRSTDLAEDCERAVNCSRSARTSTRSASRSSATARAARSRCLPRAKEKRIARRGA